MLTATPSFSMPVKLVACIRKARSRLLTQSVGICYNHVVTNQSKYLHRPDENIEPRRLSCCAALVVPEYGSTSLQAALSRPAKGNQVSWPRQPHELRSAARVGFLLPPRGEVGNLPRSV